MLEHHRLVKEFPELREQLNNIKEDYHISNQMKKYEELKKYIISKVLVCSRIHNLKILKSKD